ncbi:gob-1 [Pristionchus pacificus]|uniref:Trehalose-6-phosphate phosphatase helical bundle domain-containing protein n=1 Tax=Pristionchus pacificus TaxID=54126 RepID=A0A8R1YEX3_PRIPA|nr:gob-1 [Pristionchus pacificus]
MTAGHEELCSGDHHRPTMVQESVEDFKAELYQMQNARRAIVQAIISKGIPNESDTGILRNTLAILEDSRTNADSQRLIMSGARSIPINIRDEIIGLKKDIVYLDKLSGESGEFRATEFNSVQLSEILAPYHPVSENRFYEEVEKVVIFLNHFIDKSLPIKPIFITDWDGTMKNYCSQYATNLQPVYSAIGMSEFASRFTRLSAVLTAGPLGIDPTRKNYSPHNREPGIVELTSLPIKSGPITFSGSWGREWMLNGKRVVYDDGIPDEGFDALGRLNDEMTTVLDTDEYSQFKLVGSGVQKKVDRLTLGVQTVFNQVDSDLSAKYQEAVKERMHRVDPSQQILVFETATALEVEVCVHSGTGIVWNKANGIERLLEATKTDLKEGRVLIAGDTRSDIPMVEYSLKENPEGTFALFVGQDAELDKRVRELVGDDSRVCYIACPDVFHAGLATFLSNQDQLD